MSYREDLAKILEEHRAFMAGIAALRTQFPTDDPEGDVSRIAQLDYIEQTMREMLVSTLKAMDYSQGDIDSILQEVDVKYVQ